MRERTGRVFAFLEELVGELLVPSGHRRLLRVHIEVGREQADACPEMPAIQLPLLVHAAITGDEEPALPVAAACTLLYLGADLLDNLHDDELPAAWRGRDPAEVSLSAATLLSALPQLSVGLLGERGTPPAKLWELTRLFAQALLTMSAGQHEDVVSSVRDHWTAGDCLAMVERKTGSEGALFARAGAALATEDPHAIEEYRAFGLYLGTADQLVSDVWDIWGGGTSRDLLNGKRTLPIVHALSSLPDHKRDRLRGLLAAARGSAEVHDEVRALLEEAGSVRYTAWLVWLHQQRARIRLATAAPQGEAGRDLQSLLDRATLLPKTWPA